MKRAECMKMTIWEKLYDAAKQVLKPRQVSAIRRVIAIDREGKAVPPCGACREFMTQLMPEEYRQIEIMQDCENERIVTLGDLTPEWWI